VVTGAEGKQHASIDCLIDRSATPGEDPRFRAIFGAIIGNAGELCRGKLESVTRFLCRCAANAKVVTAIAKMAKTPEPTLAPTIATWTRRARGDVLRRRTPRPYEEGAREDAMPI
jgi:hypothetical protein